jgi:hypothetical protein
MPRSIRESLESQPLSGLVSDLQTVRPRDQWISKIELRVLTDDFATRLDAEYINGDFFVDFDERRDDDLVRILKSQSVTIEFGPGDERISLYTGDLGPNGKAKFKDALRHIVPLVTKSFGGKSRIFSLSEMFNLCASFRARRR